MDYKDYYATLGVERDASQTDIQRAYRRLARKFHPDLNKEPAAEARFKEIGEAYEVLKDPQKRTKYDQFGTAWKTAQTTGSAPPGWENFNFGGDSRGFDFGFGGGDSGFSSFFEMLFGSQGGGQRPGWRGWSTQSKRPRPGQDREARLTLTLEDTAHGGQRQITVTDPLTRQPHSLAVKIPKGVREGQKIRLAGHGGPGLNGGPAGDLYLTVELLPHSRFRAAGADLHTTLAVAPWEAALGAETEVESLEGTIKVKIPPGSSSGRKIRFRGRGLPQTAGSPGDLYAEIKVVVPEVLSARERELYEELARISRSRDRAGSQDQIGV